MILNTAGKNAIITNEKQLREHIRNNLLATIKYDNGKTVEDQIITEHGLSGEGMKIEVVDKNGDEIQFNYKISARELQKYMATAGK